MSVNTNQQNYFFNNPQRERIIPHNQTVDNVLFVADLPDETCEEDLCNFFKAYNFTLAKIFQ